MFSRAYSVLCFTRTTCNTSGNKIYLLRCRRFATTGSKIILSPKESTVWKSENQNRLNPSSQDGQQFTELLLAKPNDNLASWGNLIATTLKSKDEQLFRKYFETFKKLGGVPSLNMYSQIVEHHVRLNKLSEGRKMLLEMAHLNYPVTSEFTSVLKRLVEQNGLDSGLALKDEMLEAGASTSTSTYAILLNQASKSKRMDVAEQLLEEMKERNLPLNIILVDTLISGYFRERNIESALHWFNQIPKLQLKPSAVTYTVVIQGYLNNGHFSKADEWLDIMKRSKRKPDVYTYTSLIHAYSKVSLQRVDQLWEEMIQSGVQPNSITYKTFANAHLFHREYAKVVSIFQEMKHLETFLDTKWLNTTLNTLLKNHRFPEIMEIFHGIRDTKLVDIVTYNILLNSHLKQTDVKGALELYEYMKKRKLALDTATFNTLLNGLVKLEDFAGVERIYEEMLKQGVRTDSITLNIMTQFHAMTNGVKFALSQLEKVYQSKEASQLSINPYNTLLSCSIHDSLATSIIDEIWAQLEQQNIPPDIRTYNLILRKYLDEKQYRSFRKTLHLIQNKKLTPDTVTMNMKLEYSLCMKSTSQIDKIMDEFRRYRIKPSTETWNVIMTGLFNMEKYHEVLVKYQDLCHTKDLLPTLPTYSVVMNTYNHLGLHDMVKTMFKQVEEEPRLNRDLAPLISIILDSAGFNSSLSDVKSTWTMVRRYPLTLNNWNTYFEALLRHKDFCFTIEEFKVFLESGMTPDIKTARTVVMPFLANNHPRTRELLELFKANTPDLFSTFSDSWKQHLPA